MRSETERIHPWCVQHLPFKMSPSKRVNEVCRSRSGTPCIFRWYSSKQNINFESRGNEKGRGKKKKNICLYVKRTNCHDNVTSMQFLQIKKPTFGYVGLFGADLWFGLLWEFGNSRMVVSLRYIRGGFPKSFGTMKTRNGRTARVKYPQGRRTM